MEQIINAHLSNIEKNERTLTYLKYEMSTIITWLIWIDDYVENSDLLDFKRSIFEKWWLDKIIKLWDWIKLLNQKQNELVENYKNELYESAIYWTPINETDIERRNLEIWKELLDIVNLVNEILDIIKK